MAELVLGVGSSHSPQASTPAELWHLHSARDQTYESLNFRGDVFSFEELVVERERENLKDEVSIEVWRRKNAEVQEGIRAVANAVAAAELDVLVILGNDHFEYFPPTADMPRISVHVGPEVVSIPTPVGDAPPSRRPALWARQGEEVEAYRCQSDLGVAIATELDLAGFATRQVSTQPDGRSIGHAFTHFMRRIVPLERPPSLVPLMLNSLYRPDQLTAAECFDIGEVVGDAIRAWDSGARVGIAASGGLSHFVIDADFDTEIIKMLVTRDRAGLRSVPQERFVEGTSETMHWIALSGSLPAWAPDYRLYVPGYRTVAGTGCGMCFMAWSQHLPSTERPANGIAQEQNSGVVEC